MSREIKPQEGPQTKFLSTAADICIYGGAAGGGKAQPLDEPVLTPGGFKPMGSLKVGSVVIGKDGKAEKVIQIHPQGKKHIYRIDFIDGSSTRCSDAHLWLLTEARKVLKRRDDGNYRVYTTESITDGVKNGKHYLAPMCEEVNLLPMKGRFIKPYTFGALIGEGCLVADNINISCGDIDVFSEIQKDGYEIREHSSQSNAFLFGFAKFSKEKKWLDSFGLLCKSENKFIPDCYKIASAEDRYAVIQGLMDTDGYADSRGHCEYSTVSERLALDVQWIIRSLGGKATISEKIPRFTSKNGEKKEGQKAYIVYIRVKDNSRLFRIKRKKDRCIGKTYNGNDVDFGNRIVGVEDCGYLDCQCITVDRPDGLYITKDFIVTHNSYALLMMPLRYKNVPGFGCTIFRKNYNQIFAQGGLWDEATDIYSGIKGARIHRGDGSWTFDCSNGGQAKVSFAHIERDEEVSKWQGSQIGALCFDELCHFSEKIFFYMLSRNRSSCGVKPFVRATCNPDADSWVAKFIAWWIDQDTGYPIKERSGVLRYFIRRDNKAYWGDSRKALREQFGLTKEEGDVNIKSATFIMSSVYDNQELLKVNPSYLANLNALGVVDKERLLYGNWKIMPTAGMYFKRSQVEMVDSAPPNMRMVCRAWDLAATAESRSGDPDYTAGVLIGIKPDNSVVILNVINQRITAGQVEKLIYNTALIDRKQYGMKYRVRIPQDPGAAGKIVANNYIKLLAGFSVKALPVTGSKEQRATPLAAQWQNGHVSVLLAEWNEEYFSQMESFPEAIHDDMVDASSDAFNEVTSGGFNLISML